MLVEAPAINWHGACPCPGLTALAARARRSFVMHMEVQPILDDRPHDGRPVIPLTSAELGTRIRRAALVAAAIYLAEEPRDMTSCTTESDSAGEDA